MEFKSRENKSIISFVQEFSKRKSSSAMTLWLLARHTVITMELAGGVVEKTVLSPEMLRDIRLLMQKEIVVSRVKSLKLFSQQLED